MPYDTDQFDDEDGINEAEVPAQRDLMTLDEQINQHRSLMNNEDLSESQRQAESMKWGTKLHKQSYLDAYDMLENGGSVKNYLKIRREMDGWTPMEERIFQDAYGAAKERRNSPEGQQERENQADIEAYADALGQMPVFARDIAVAIDLGRRDLQSTLARAATIGPGGSAKKEFINGLFNKIAAEPLHEGEDYADRLNHDANKMEQARMLANEGLPQWYQSAATASAGAARSMWTATALSPLGMYGVVGGFTASRANQAITEAKDAGLEGWDAARYVGQAAAIEGLVTTAFSMIPGAAGFEGLFGAEKGLTKAGAKPLLMHVLKTVGAELPEENITEILDMYNQAAYGTGEEVTWESALQTMKQVTLSTILSTAGHAGVQGAFSQNALKYREGIIDSWTKSAEEGGLGYGWTVDQANAVFERAGKRKGDFGDNLNKEIYDELMLTANLGEWVVQNPEAARELAGKRQMVGQMVVSAPSRTDFEEVGFPRRELAERAEVAGNIQEILDDPELLAAAQKGVEVKEYMKYVQDMTNTLIKNPNAGLEDMTDKDLDLMHSTLMEAAMGALSEDPDSASAEESIMTAIMNVRQEQNSRGRQIVNDATGMSEDQGQVQEEEEEERGGWYGLRTGEGLPDSAIYAAKHGISPTTQDMAAGERGQDVRTAVPEASEAPYNAQKAIEDAGIDSIPDIGKATAEDLQKASKMLRTRLRNIEGDDDSAKMQREQVKTAIMALRDEESGRVAKTAIEFLGIDKQLESGEAVDMPTPHQFLRAITDSESFERMVQDEMDAEEGTTREVAERVIRGFFRRTATYSNDEMTGFENVGTETGRAVAWRAYKLVAQEIAKSGKTPVTLVSMDTHNLGGFNSALSEKGGSHFETNEHLKNIYSFYKDEIEAISDKSRLVRLGGDEQEGIVFGATKEEVDAAMARAKVKAIEYTKSHKTSDGTPFSEIVHGKDKSNLKRRGVGVNVFVTDLNNEAGHSLLEKKADQMLTRMGERGLYDESGDEAGPTGTLASEGQAEGTRGRIETTGDRTRQADRGGELEGRSTQEASRTLNASKIKEAIKGISVERSGEGWTATLGDGTKVDFIPTKSAIAATVDDVIASLKESAPDRTITRTMAQQIIDSSTVGGVMVPAGVTVRLADGSTFTSGRVTVLVDPKNANDTTIRHEALHLARHLGFFNDAEGKKIWDALVKKYGNDEEVIASAREAWHGPEGLWDKIRQFLNEVFAKLGFDLDPDLAMAKTFTEEFWKKNPGAALEAGQASPEAYLNKERFPAAVAEQDSAPVGSIKFQIADVKKAKLEGESKKIAMTEGAQKEDAFKGVRAFIYTEVAALSDMIDPKSKWHQPKDGQNLIEYARGFFSKKGLDALREAFSGDEPPPWVEGENYTAAVKEEGLEKLTSKKKIMKEDLLNGISDNNDVLRGKIGTILNRKDYSDGDSITGGQLLKIIDGLKKDDFSVWYAIKKELEFAERIRNGEKISPAWGKAFLADNVKTGGKSWDFGLLTCMPTIRCDVCYAGANATMRLEMSRARVRHTIVTALYPEEVGRGIAEYVKSRPKTKNEMPFLRVNGSGDLTFDWQARAINEAIANLDRPVHIFSRSHIPRRGGSAGLDSISNGWFDPEHPENGVVVYKMGSVDAQLVKEYGLEFLRNNLRERGIINSYLVGSVDDIEIIKSLREEGIDLILHVNATKEIITALDDAGLILTSKNPKGYITTPICACSLDSGPKINACSTCLVAGGPCFAWGTQIAMTEDGKLIPYTEMLTMDELPKGKMYSMSRIGVPSDEGMKAIMAQQVAAHAWKAAAHNLGQKISQVIRQKKGNVVVENPRSREVLFTIPYKDVGVAKAIQKDWVAFSESLMKSQKEVRDPIDRSRKRLKQVMEEDWERIQGVSAMDRAVAKARGVGEAPKFQFTNERQSKLWSYPEGQKISSAGTSINKSKLPAVFSTVKWRPGTVNADIGGGKYDNATELLASKDVENLIYDPFNRSQEHNREVVARIASGQADTATISNVLNVISEESSRDRVIAQAADALKSDGTAYFTIYEKNKSGVGEETSSGWQNNRTAESYIPEIEKHFSSVERKGNMLVATGPRGTGIKFQFVPKKHDFPVTSIKNDFVTELRELRGVEELTSEHSNEQTWIDEASYRLSLDSRAGERLVGELEHNPRNLTPVESVILAMHHRRLYSNFETLANEQFEAHQAGNEVRAAELLPGVMEYMALADKTEEVARQAGTLAGQSLYVRRLMLQKNFSKAALLTRARVMNGGEDLTPAQVNEISAGAEKIRQLEEALASKEANIEELQAKLKEVTDGIATTTKRSRAYRRTEKVVTVKRHIDDAFAEFKKAWEDAGEVFHGGPENKGVQVKFSMKKGEQGQSQKRSVDTPGIRAAAKSLAMAFIEGDVESFGEFFARSKMIVGENLSASEQVFRDAWEEAGGPDLDMDGATPADITRDARNIYRRLYEEGYVDRDVNVGIVQDAMKDTLKDIPATWEALSAYGQFSVPPQDAVSVALRDHYSQLRGMKKLEQLEKALERATEMQEQGKTNEEILEALEKEDLMLKATGPQRDRPSDIVRQLEAQVHEAKKEMPVSSEEKTGRLQSALNAAKRAVRNAISDMEDEMASGVQIKKGKKIQSDTELDNLRAQRDEVRKRYREMFPPKGATEEQKNAATLNALNKAIDVLEGKLDAGDIGYEAKTALRSTPQIEAARARLNELKAIREVLRDKSGLTEQRTRLMNEARLRARIAEEEAILARGDFAPKTKPLKREPSKQELVLKKELADAKAEVFKKMAEYHLAHLSPKERVVDLLRETMHLSRSVMTSIDLSAVLRQGGIGVFSHPQLAIAASKKMAQALMNEQGQFEAAEAIRNHELGRFAELCKLSITEDDGRITRQEEAFMGRWAKHVPGVAASGRAYTTFLNNMRFQMFAEMVSSLGRNGQVTVDEGKVIAKYINAATGRADFKMLNNAAANLNTVFFAPRFVASRFQWIATPFMLPFMNTTGRVKTMIAMEYARTFSGLAVFLASLLAFGHLVTDDEDEKPTIEWDPRSTDFLKVKFGDTRMDPTGGISSAIVLSARLGLGQTKTAMGEIKKYGKEGGYGSDTRASVLGRFLRYKMAPIPGALWTAASDFVDPVGQKKTPIGLAAGIMFPLSVREVGDAMSNHGIPLGTALGTLALFGMSASTYGPRTEYAAATEEERSKIFKDDLKSISWDAPELAYSEYLNEEQLQMVDKARWQNAGLRLYQATAAKPKDKEAQVEWEEDVQEALQALESFPIDDRRKAFDAYWFKPDKSGKKRTRGDAYWRHVRALNKL